MPESMSRERRAIIKQLGAELILTPAHLGMAGAVTKANEIALLETKAFLSDQFNNPANPEIHFKTTGKEIWEQTVGKIDIFVVGIGTGGTISGVGKYLKSKNPKIQIIAVEPLESAILSGGNPSLHKIQGIGSGFIPKNLDPSVIDEVIQISGDDAIRESRELGKTNGILVGISSGANILASKIVANRFENMNKKIVTILNDSGERYTSTELFNY